MNRKIFAATVAAVIIMQFFSPFYITPSPMYGGEVVRLHVIANSDTDDDQNLKLAVRDAVLASADSVLKTDNADDAAGVIFKNIETIEKNAKAVIQKAGFAYDVQVVPGVFEFPSKSYQNITLPKGRYRAVRVIIGEGKGKNWWCVMFPPLCFTDKTTAYMPDADVFEKTAKPEIRIKLLELLKK